MTSHLHSLRAVLITGMAAWMSVAVLNNATDPGTNIHLIGTMLSMEPLLGDPVLGNGLEWRALEAGYAGMVLDVVVVVQAVIAALLWRTGWLYGRLSFGVEGNADGSEVEFMARRAANLALCAFSGLWLTFMTGGFWFGYWMKQGPAQQVHMTLLLIAIGCGLLVNSDTK